MNRWYCVKCGSSGFASNLLPASPGAQPRWRVFVSLVTCPVCGDSKGHAGVLPQGTRILPSVPTEAQKRVFPFEVPLGLAKVSYPEVYEFVVRKGLENFFPRVKIVEHSGRVGLYIPIVFEGREVGYQIRFFRGKPKYFSSFPSYVLYGWDTVSPPTCVVVEGVFDTFVLPNKCIASFGKRLTTRQIELLKLKGFEKVIVSFDADALDEAFKVSRRLIRSGFETLVLKLPRGSPGDFTTEEFLSFPCFDLLLRQKPLREVLNEL